MLIQTCCKKLSLLEEFAIKMAKGRKRGNRAKEVKGDATHGTREM